MTKKQLIEMLSDVPDDALITIARDSYNLIGSNISLIDIRGYYENGGKYVLSSANVRPYKTKESND